MTKYQAERLLLNYPFLWKAYHHRENDILHGGKSSSDWATVHYSGGGSHSDGTADKAIKLAEMSDTVQIIAVIGKWVNEYLSPLCRPILIEKWRGYDWQGIERRLGVMQCQVMEYWNNMIQSLIHYAGTVSGLAGNAFVSFR